MCIMVVDFSILFQLSVLILTYHKYKALQVCLVLYNISYSVYIYVPLLVTGHNFFFIWKYFYFWIHHPQKIKQSSSGNKNVQDKYSLQ
jgi:hypothetical protein